MKNRAVVALFVAFLLALPALAQQSTSDQSAQQTASQPSTTGTAADAATGKAPLQYDSHQGFWGKVNPFARKK